jgi:hypothetical protein
MNYQRFRPRDAVKILADRRRTKELKTWTIARLLSWISLDQRPRRVHKQSARVCGQMRSRASNAKLAGNVVLASLIKRRSDDRASLRMFLMFWKSNGFRLILKSPRSPKSWMRTLTQVKEDMVCVHAIMSYLCRYKKYGRDPQKLSIEAAKRFVVTKENKPSALSKTSKTWEPHKHAASYIFSFISPLSDIAQTQSIDEFVDRLEAIASDQKLVDELLGNAAYAADLLKDIARDVHNKDFEGIEPIEPHLEMFDANEEQIIESINLEAQSERYEDWSPKSLPIAKIAAERRAALESTASIASDTTES